MSLHYFVKLEMLTGQMLSLSCYRKKLQNLSHLSCGLQIREIWIQLITVCQSYCNRRCTKHVSLTWTNWNRDWEQSGAIRPKAGLCRHCGSRTSVASLTAQEQWCMFCTPSLTTFPTYFIVTLVRTRNTFCGTWYLPHSHVHNERTVLL